METVRVQLNFPIEGVKKPVIWHLAHDFGLVFSIRRAHIDPKIGGFTELELTGPRATIMAALEWVQAEGLEVQTLGSDGAQEWLVR